MLFFFQESLGISGISGVPVCLSRNFSEIFWFWVMGLMTSSLIDPLPCGKKPTCQSNLRNRKKPRGVSQGTLFKLSQNNPPNPDEGPFLMFSTRRVGASLHDQHGDDLFLRSHLSHASEAVVKRVCACFGFAFYTASTP